MTLSEKLKYYPFRASARILQKLHLYKYFNLKDDQRPTTSYKLAFFCGASGIDYLNACLLSVYLSWDSLPNISIITDGTDPSFLRKNLIDWPKEVEIETWEDAAFYFKDKGDRSLYDIALNKRWPGKKFVSLLYLASKSLILYSDSDVLWFGAPAKIDTMNKPYIKMGKDVDPFFTDSILQDLPTANSFRKIPLNAGVMFLSGDFSSYPYWDKLRENLLQNPDTDNFAEQTAFAILNNHFNGKDFWNEKEILIKIDDMYSLGYTKPNHESILARHYVSTKNISFWRDFLHLCIRKKKNYSLTTN
ncbi:hypothetical protein [Pedobacter agri]|uniref:hypothetical protein n=1 Tax=Pedobacter agri TaxID=454586 RepID=UPI00278A7DEE|nr:hypothetical protein [Pedobacter agri]MDQ1141163.1 hypothetical protein [Pedobacter agri]